MSLLANPVMRPGMTGYFEGRPIKRRNWLSFALVALLHVAGLYGVATWAPRSEWARLWQPVEVKLIQDTPPPPPPPEVRPVEEPPPPPPPKEVVVRKAEPPPPAPTPVVEEKPVTPPAPVMTAAPSAPVVTVAPTFEVPPQPPAPPAPPAVVAAPPAAPAGPRTVTGIEYVRGPVPAYPMMSRRLGEQGKVMIKALVDEAGRAVNVVVHQSSGRPRLDEAAKKAVMEALFKPYRDGGKAEQVYVVVPVIFKLEG